MARPCEPHVLCITVEARPICCHPHLHTRVQTMPQKTARENEIAREKKPPRGNDDMAVLRDDELDAITGGLGKTIGGKAKIIDGRSIISPGLVLAPH